MNKLVYKYLDDLFDITFSHEVETISNSIIFILEFLEFIINFKKNENKIKLLFIKIELNIIKIKI